MTIQPDARTLQRSYRFEPTGETLPYVLFVSSKVSPERKAPLIVALHGLGGDGNFLVRDRLVDLAEEGGYIVVGPLGYNVSGWYGSPPIAMGGPVTPPNLAELSEQDVMSVLELVRREFNVDPDRTYLMGHSMGGAGALFLGHKHADNWAAVAAIAPAAFMMERDRADILGRMKAAGVPVLIIQGDQDPVVPAENTRRWGETLRELGMQGQYIELEGGDHGNVIANGMPDIFRLFAAQSMQVSGLAGTQQVDAAAEAQRREANNRRPDEPGTGPYPAIKEQIAALPRHVVYRPADLAALGSRKLGVVAWGNGACSEDGASSRFHLLQIASHGYLVLALGRIYSGPGAPPPEARPQVDGPPSGRTLASDLTDAITWALAENERAGSPYQGRIDPALVAVSGFSCGGLQSLRVAGDPRVKTAVLHNTGVLIEPSTVPGMDVGKEALDDLHTPVIYILGGPPDIAYENGMDDFRRIQQVPVAVANLAVGHGGTFDEPNGGAAARVATAWLEWQLRGDTTAARQFIGPDCGLCGKDGWTLQWRNQSAPGAVP